MTVKFDDLKLEPEYQVALELIKARVQAEFSQEVLAEK